MKDLVVITKVGALNLQVCTTLTDEKDIVRRVNEENLCGTTLGWVMDKRPEVAPVQCADYPGRKHYILAA